MTNNTMPERIYAWALDDRQEWSDASETDADFDDVEYVRADLITGDANEPLEEGQFRWVSVGGERHAARLEEMLNDYGNLDLFFCTTDGCSWSEEELDFIGPVIRPPDNVARPKDDSDQDRSAFDSLMSRMSRVV